MGGSNGMDGSDSMGGMGGSTDMDKGSATRTLGVVIDPSEPVTTDPLTARVTISPEAPLEDVDYSWTRDGKESSVTTAAVPATQTSRGEEWTVVATFGELEATSSVTIGNSAPVVFDVFVVTDSTAQAGALSCVASGVDPDGDDLDWSYEWLIDGEVVEGENDALLTSGHSAGDEVTCKATASDGDLETSGTSNEVLTVEEPLTLATARVSPDLLYACSAPTCQVELQNDSDPHVTPDSVNLEYIWLQNGEIVDGAHDSRLSDATLSYGDELRCRIRWQSAEELPFQVTESDTVTVTNLPPEATPPSVTPVAYPGDLMTCTTTGYLDPDCGSSDQFSYSWYADGVLIDDEQTNTLSTDSILGGTIVRCEVTPFDGIESGAAEASPEVRIEASGFDVIGDLPGSFAGWSVAILDDLDGDNLAELAIGAPLANPGGDREQAGQVYVVSGVAADGQIDLADVTAGVAGTVFTGESGGRPHATYLCAGYSLSHPPCGGGFPGLTLTASDLGTTYGPVGDAFGFSINNLGDMDGDGIGDAVFGAPYAYEFPEVFRGKAYAISGARLRSTNIASVISNASADGFFALGENGSRIAQAPDLDDLESYNGDLFGYATAAVGDMNGDGLQDFAATALNYGDEDGGRVYVIYGRQDGQAIDMEALSATPPTGGFTITGYKPGALAHQYGIGIQGVGDIDGDGYDDLLLQPRFNTDLRQYVVYGKAKRARSIELSNPDAGLPVGHPPRTMYVWSPLNLIWDDGFVITSGRDISQRPSGGGGDVNGDGLSDMAFLGEGVGGVSEIAVQFGVASRDDVNLQGAVDGNGGFLITGDVNAFTPQGAVRIGGDFNADGLDDIVIASVSDSVYVVYGKTDGAPVSLDDVAQGEGGFQFTVSGAAQSGFGTSLDVGDINGDGMADFLVGAYDSDSDRGSDVGAAYVRFGRDYGNHITFRGGALDDTFTGTAADEVFVSGTGNDILIGGGGADVLYGGAGDDVLEIADLNFLSVRGGRGEDTLKLAQEGLTFDLNALRGRVRDIERLDLEGNGQQTLNIERLDLLRLSSSSNELVVMGDPGDSVASFATTWFAEGNEERLGRTFHRLTNGHAVLLVETEMSTSIAPSLLTTALDVPESTLAAGLVGSILANDPDGSVVSYSIIDEHGDPGVFELNEATGELVVVDPAPLDFETGKRNFALTVQIQDDAGLQQQGVVTVTVTDVPEAPVMADATLELSVSEADPNMTLLGVVFAIDPDIGDTVEYSLLGMVDGPFEVDPQTGEIVVADQTLLDFETAPVLNFQVEARDSTDLTAVADVTVNVVDATVFVTNRRLYFVANDASIWDSKPLNLAVAPPFDIDLSEGSPAHYRLPFPDAFGEWEATMEMSGTISMSSDIDFGTGEVDAYVPVDVTLEFPDEIVEGESFALTSTWAVAAEAKFEAETPKAAVNFSLEGLDDVGFDLELCAGGCLPPVGHSWNYSGPTALVDFDLKSASLTGAVSGTPTVISASEIEVPFLDTSVNWDSALENVLSLAGLPSTTGSIPLVAFGGEPFAYFDYVTFSTEVFTKQKYHQSNELSIDGVTATLVFAEIDQSVPFDLGGTTNIDVPVGADANLDGRIEIEVEFSLDQTFTTNFGVAGESGQHVVGGAVTVRSAFNPGQLLYFSPYQKGPLIDARLTFPTDFSDAQTFMLQGFNTPHISGALDRSN